jgi:integrase
VGEKRHRRGAGEGTIYYDERRAEWVGSVHLGYENSRRRRKVVYAKTFAEARRRLAEVQRATEAGLPVTPARLTVAAFVEQFLSAVEPSIRPRTHKRYAELLRLHVVPAIGSAPLAKLSPQQVQVMLNGIGRSPQTVAHVRAALRRALTFGQRWGVVARNAAALTEAPHVVRAEPPVLSPAEARRFLDAIRRTRLEALYAVALGVGLREGEAFGLKWCDFDLDAGTLTVRRSLVRLKGGPVLAEPKTARSRRTVALPSVAVAALREHRRHQLEERLVAGERWEGLGDWDGLVFTTTIGTPLWAGDVLRDLRAHLERAGLPRLRFHDLRHSAASLMLAQGVPVRVVMETLGHSTITTTANIYQHVLPDLQRDAADRMEAVLGAHGA